MDAASSAADAGGSAAAIEHDVAITAAALKARTLGAGQLTVATQANATVETVLAARALGINAPATVSAGGQDAAVAGGTLAAAAGKFPPSYTDQGDPCSLLLLAPTPQVQVPQPTDNFFVMKKEWTISISTKERLAANFYNESVMQYIFF